MMVFTLIKFLIFIDVAHRGGRVFGGFWNNLIGRVAEPLVKITRNVNTWWKYGTMKNQYARLCKSGDEERCISYGAIVDKLNYYLYTKWKTWKKPHRLYIENIDEAVEKYASFEPSQKLVIITHGLTSSHRIDWVQRATNALLRQNTNVIASDYKSRADFILLANNNGLIPLAEAVGRHLGRLIEALINKGWNGSQIHLVGHSLGGHISGIAGKYVKSRNLSVARITALDPVGRVFDSLEPERRLHFDDAEFTDCIFTDPGHIGQTNPTCGANYYANCYGRKQPSTTLLFSSLEAHSRVNELFVESLHSNHVFQAKHCSGGIPCKDVHPDQCSSSHNVTIKMGYPASPDYQGFFYVETNGRYPFAKIVHDVHGEWRNTSINHKTKRPTRQTTRR